MGLKYTLTQDSLTVILDGRSYSVRRGAPKFDAARKAILDERWSDVPSLVSSGLAIEKWIGSTFTVCDGAITWRGEPIDPALNTRMLAMADAGEDPTGWLRFWERLQKNPSYRSVKQLYRFLAHEGIPVDADGFMLAYKSVRRDYKDFHSGTFDNRPGKTCEMDRNKISDDPQVACHEGLHCGALKYAQAFGEDRRIIIVRVDPADVVCVPYDASAMKVRVCRYTVLGNYCGELLPDTTFQDDEDAPPPPHIIDEPEAEVGPDAEVEDAGTPYTMDQAMGDVAEVFAGSSSDEAANPWAKYDAMGEAELCQVLFPDLRKYARHHLQIIGASKMKGTKHDLVLRILDVRENPTS